MDLFRNVTPKTWLKFDMQLNHSLLASNFKAKKIKGLL